MQLMISKNFIWMNQWFLLIFFLEGQTIAEKCGTAKVLPSEANKQQLYIIGGENSRLGMFPSVGYIEFVKGERVTTCTTTFIKPKWAITAKNCVQGLCTNEGTVILGTITESDRKPENEFPIARIVFQKSSESRPGVALVELAKEVDLAAANGAISPACLPPTGLSPNGHLFLVGWGLNTRNEQVDSKDELHYMLAKIETCECYVDEDQFCVQGMKNNQHVYKGDTGGPALLYSGGQFFLLGTYIGTGSMEIKKLANKTETRKFEVYINTTSLLDWIENVPSHETVDNKC